MKHQMTRGLGLFLLGIMAAPAAAAQTAVASSPQPYTREDVAFMTGMIAHHGQALLMAGWAPSHGAGAAVRALCERIVVGQGDEIVLMQRWLRDHHEPVPATDGSHDMMAGMGHDMMPLMPGMLTMEQLHQLDAARGPEFDRLFLTFMIQHHRGAIAMVDHLFSTQGSGEEERTYKFASDVFADQTTEIDRMQRMLDAMPAVAQHQ